MQSKLIKLILVVFLTTPIITFAQTLNFGLTMNAGPGWVSSNLPHGGDYHQGSSISGTAGLFLEKRLSKKSLVGAEVLWAQMGGMDVIENVALIMWTGTPPNQVLTDVGWQTYQYLLQASYVGLPVYYKFSLSKWGLKGGVQSNLFLFSSARYDSFGELNGEPFTQQGTSDNIHFRQFDFGPRMGLEYQLSKRLRLRMDYYYGLTDITGRDYPWQRRNRQLNFGLNYSIKLKEATKTLSSL